MSVTSPNLIDFQTFFHWQLLSEIRNKVVNKSSTTSYARLYTTWWNSMSENKRHSETNVVINDKSQDSVMW